jgi:hypothetical protein|tara:strand:- start:699 stop:1064 length:366 start_codon:yes stop_codon:yes gene_type:complete
VATTVLDNQYFTSKFIYETDLQKEPLQNLTNGAAEVKTISVFNGGNANELFLKLYDTIAEVSGTQTQADYIFQIDASTDAVFHFPDGLTIENGLTARLVTTAALSGNTDPQASTVVEIVYT